VILRQEKRVRDAVGPGLATKAWFATLLTIVVWVQDAEGPKVLAVEFEVPVPRIEMPIPAGIVTEVVQVHVPAGIFITSPLTATCVGPLMTAFTLFRLQSAAV